MKQYNKLIGGVVCFWVLLAVISSYFIFNSSHGGTKDKGYLIDINRINTALLSGIPVTQIDFSQYKYLKAADYALLPLTKSEIIEFINPQNIPDGLEYRIQPLFNNNELTGYIRYTYETNKEFDISRILLAYNICLLLLVIVILIIMFYIRHSVLKPFNDIIDMPYQLSKGRLKANIQESKSRFFGKFLWGLDLLRENLETHKKRELQLEKEKKTMVLSISHDIKTPLSSIKLYSKAIYSNLYDTMEKKAEAAKIIEEKADQIEGFVGDIIKTSTHDLLDIEVNISEFYLSQLIKQISKTYYDKLKLLRIEFSVDNYDDILLKGDIDRLMEVLENIIENAIKYGDNKSISISFSDEDYCKLITVTNSGTPVQSTYFVHMFESFWRGANAHDKKGSGLGLYICKEIMTRIDGDIFAQSTEDTMSLTVVVRYSE